MSAMILPCRGGGGVSHDFRYSGVNSHDIVALVGSPNVLTPPVAMDIIYYLFPCIKTFNDIRTV